MIKFLKIALISAILTNSGFSNENEVMGRSSMSQPGEMPIPQAEVAVISGDVVNDGVMELGQNTLAYMAGGSVIHNYGIIQGPAATGVDRDDNPIEITRESNIDDTAISSAIYSLDDSKKAVIGEQYLDYGDLPLIINYDHIMENAEGYSIENWDKTNFYRPTAGAKIQGAVDVSQNINTVSKSADLIYSIDNPDYNKADKVMLLTTKNACNSSSIGRQQICDLMMSLTNDDKENVVTVNASIANESNPVEGDESISHSLMVSGNFDFKGDQSHFNQSGTNVTFSESNSNISASKAFPKSDVAIIENSKVAINAENVVISGNVRVGKAMFNVNKNSKVTLTKGSVLRFCQHDFPSDDPMKMVWPEGSFAGELTKLSEVEHYNITLNEENIDLIHGKNPILDMLGRQAPSEKQGRMLLESNPWYDSKYKYEYYEKPGGDLDVMFRFQKTVSIDTLTSEERDGETYYKVIFTQADNPLFSNDGSSNFVWIYYDKFGDYYISDDGSVMGYVDHLGSGVDLEGTWLIQTLSRAAIDEAKRPTERFYSDNVFSYRKKDGENAYTRCAQNIIIPKTVDFSKITNDKSTWLVLKDDVNSCFYVLHKGKELGISENDYALMQKAEISTSALFMGIEYHIIQESRGEQFNRLSSIEGTNETGYWSGIDTSIIDFNAVDFNAVSTALKASSIGWATLREYNSRTNPATPYTWKENQTFRPDILI